MKKLRAKPKKLSPRKKVSGGCSGDNRQYLNPWKYNNEVFSGDITAFEAFVYIITNLTTNRQYIGKKVFWTLRRPKPNARRVRAESNWKQYYGSCLALKADIKKFGVLNFRREILRLCKTRGESSFFELKEQFARGVLQSDNFYNEAIGKWRTRYPIANTVMLTA